MDIKFCERPRCQKVAVGTGNRPVRWCRPHYVEECGPEFVQARVIVEDPTIEAVACARTGQDIPRGGIVWLDPAETSIVALVYAGIVEVVEDEAPTAAQG